MSLNRSEQTFFRDLQRLAEQKILYKSISQEPSEIKNRAWERILTIAEKLSLEKQIVAGNPHFKWITELNISVLKLPALKNFLISLCEYEYLSHKEEVPPNTSSHLSQENLQQWMQTIGDHIFRLMPVNSISIERENYSYFFENSRPEAATDRSYLRL
jgi:hypothetical protein